MVTYIIIGSFHIAIIILILFLSQILMNVSLTMEGVLTPVQIQMVVIFCGCPVGYVLQPNNHDCIKSELLKLIVIIANNIYYIYIIYIYIYYIYIYIYIYYIYYIYVYIYIYNIYIYYI